MTPLPCATAADDRAAAALRLNLRDALAEALMRRVPHHVTILDDGDEIDAEAELHPTDAHELARDLVEDLACRGYVVGRAPV